MSKRVLKYKTISKSEEAPVVGSIVTERDTIFVKQITATEFELYASDETGYVVKLDKTIDKVSFNAMILEYVSNHVSEFKNILNLTPLLRLSLNGTNTEFIVHHNGIRMSLNPSDFYSVRDPRTGDPVFSCDKDDIVEFKGEDYPEQYVKINNKEIIGKNFTESYVIDLSDENLHGLQLEAVEIGLIEKKAINIERFEGSSVGIRSVLPNESLQYNYMTEGVNRVLVVDGNITLRVGISGSLGIVNVKSNEETIATWEIGEYGTGDFTIAYSNLEGKNIVIEAIVAE